MGISWDNITDHNYLDVSESEGISHNHGQFKSLFFDKPMDLGIVTLCIWIMYLFTIIY